MFRPMMMIYLIQFDFEIDKHTSAGDCRAYQCLLLHRHTREAWHNTHYLFIFYQWIINEWELILRKLGMSTVNLLFFFSFVFFVCISICLPIFERFFVYSRIAVFYFHFVFSSFFFCFCIRHFVYDKNRTRLFA